MVETDKPTVVDAHAVFEGKLKGKDVQILGRFKGEIELSGRLMMGDGSNVEAKVIAEQADIAGHFSGDLKVKNLILLEKARVEGTLEAQGVAADGIETALHYGDGLDNAKNTAFRKAFKDKAGRDADVYAVQGYDAAQLLALGLEAVKGNIEDEANLYKALRAAKIESPRGPISMSPSQNVTQNIYLRKVEGGQNKVVGVAVENLADPGTGCCLA